MRSVNVVHRVVISDVKLRYIEVGEPSTQSESVHAALSAPLSLCISRPPPSSQMLAATRSAQAQHLPKADSYEAQMSWNEAVSLDVAIGKSKRTGQLQPCPLQVAVQARAGVTGLCKQNLCDVVIDLSDYAAESLGLRETRTTINMTPALASASDLSTTVALLRFSIVCAPEAFLTAQPERPVLPHTSGSEQLRLLEPIQGQGSGTFHRDGNTQSKRRVEEARGRGSGLGQEAQPQAGLKLEPSAAACERRRSSAPNARRLVEAGVGALRYRSRNGMEGLEHMDNVGATTPKPPATNRESGRRPSSRSSAVSRSTFNGQERQRRRGMCGAELSRTSAQSNGNGDRKLFASSKVRISPPALASQLVSFSSSSSSVPSKRRADVGSTESVQSDLAQNNDRSIREIVRLLMRDDSTTSQLASSDRMSQMSRRTPQSSRVSLWSAEARSRSSSLAQCHNLTGRCHSRLRRSIDDSFMSHGALEREKAWYRNAKQRYDGMHHDSPFGTFFRRSPHTSVSSQYSFQRASNTSGVSASSLHFAFEDGNRSVYRRSHSRHASAGQQTPLSCEQLSSKPFENQQAAHVSAISNFQRWAIIANEHSATSLQRTEQIITVPRNAATAGKRPRSHGDDSNAALPLEYGTGRSTLSSCAPNFIVIDFFVVIGNREYSSPAMAGLGFSPSILRWWSQRNLAKRGEPHSSPPYDLPSGLPQMCLPPDRFGVRTCGAAPQPTTFHFSTQVHDVQSQQQQCICVTSIVFYEELCQIKSLDSSDRARGVQRIFAPKCISILSRWPFHNFFETCLLELYLASSAGVGDDTPFERHSWRRNFSSSIQNLLLMRLPLKLWTAVCKEPRIVPINLDVGISSQRSFRLQFQALASTLQHPTQMQSGIADFAKSTIEAGSGLSAHALLARVSTHRLLTVLAACLLERRLVLLSSDVSVLSDAAETLRLLLRPFDISAGRVFLPYLPGKDAHSCTSNASQGVNGNTDCTDVPWAMLPEHTPFLIGTVFGFECDDTRSVKLGFSDPPERKNRRRQDAQRRKRRNWKRRSDRLRRYVQQHWKGCTLGPGGTELVSQSNSDVNMVGTDEEALDRAIAAAQWAPRGGYALLLDHDELISGDLIELLGKDEADMDSSAWNMVALQARLSSMVTWSCLTGMGSCQGPLYSSLSAVRQEFCEWHDAKAATSHTHSAQSDKVLGARLMESFYDETRDDDVRRSFVDVAEGNCEITDNSDLTDSYRADEDVVLLVESCKAVSDFFCRTLAEYSRFVVPSCQGSVPSFDTGAFLASACGHCRTQERAFAPMFVRTQLFKSFITESCTVPHSNSCLLRQSAQRLYLQLATLRASLENNTASFAKYDVTELEVRLPLLETAVTRSSEGIELSSWPVVPVETLQLSRDDDSCSDDDTDSSVSFGEKTSGGDDRSSLWDTCQQREHDRLDSDAVQAHQNECTHIHTQVGTRRSKKSRSRSMVTEEVFENERFVPLLGWGAPRLPGDPGQWTAAIKLVRTHKDGSTTTTRRFCATNSREDAFQSIGLPSRDWYWLDAWHIDTSGRSSRTSSTRDTPRHSVDSRMSASLSRHVTSDREGRSGDGWVYGSFFSRLDRPRFADTLASRARQPTEMALHARLAERSLDVVRRRRWVRTRCKRNTRRMVPFRAGRSLVLSTREPCGRRISSASLSSCETASSSIVHADDNARTGNMTLSRTGTPMHGSSRASIADGAPLIERDMDVVAVDCARLQRCLLGRSGTLDPLATARQQLRAVQQLATVFSECRDRHPSRSKKGSGSETSEAVVLMDSVSRRPLDLATLFSVAVLEKLFLLAASASECPAEGWSLPCLHVEGGRKTSELLRSGAKRLLARLNQHSHVIWRATAPTDNLDCLAQCSNTTTGNEQMHAGSLGDVCDAVRAREFAAVAAFDKLQEGVITPGEYEQVMSVIAGSRNLETPAIAEEILTNSDGSRESDSCDDKMTDESELEDNAGADRAAMTIADLMTDNVEMATSNGAADQIELLQSHLRRMSCCVHPDSALVLTLDPEQKLSPVWETKQQAKTIQAVTQEKSSFELGAQGAHLGSEIIPEKIALNPETDPTPKHNLGPEPEPDRNLTSQYEQPRQPKQQQQEEDQGFEQGHEQEHRLVAKQSPKQKSEHLIVQETKMEYNKQSGQKADPGKRVGHLVSPRSQSTLGIASTPEVERGEDQYGRDQSRIQSELRSLKDANDALMHQVRVLSMQLNASLRVPGTIDQSQSQTYRGRQEDVNVNADTQGNEHSYKHEHKLGLAASEVSTDEDNSKNDPGGTLGSVQATVSRLPMEPATLIDELHACNNLTRILQDSLHDEVIESSSESDSGESSSDSICENDNDIDPDRGGDGVRSNDLEGPNHQDQARCTCRTSADSDGDSESGIESDSTVSGDDTHLSSAICNGGTPCDTLQPLLVTRVKKMEMHDLVLRKHCGMLCLAIDERIHRSTSQRRLLVSAMSTLPNNEPGPAQRSGMQMGDELMAVGGRNVCGAKLQRVIELLQASPDVVVVRVARPAPPVGGSCTEPVVMF